MSILSNTITTIRKIYSSLFGNFIDVSRLESIQGQQTTDESIEHIDVSFAKDVREAIKWYGANSDEVPSIVNANKIGIIGKKVNIQSRIKNNPELNEAIEDYISWFSEVGNCDVTGRFHLNEAWRTMVEFIDKDGGFLIRHHFNTKWDIPYRFEIIEVGMIDISKNNDTDTLNGLKKDKYGRITHIWLYNTQERLESSLISMDSMLYFSPVWISLSQYTAVSKLAPILPSIDRLNRYTKAELDAAIEKSKAGKYWKTALYDDLIKIVKQIQDSKEKKASIKEVMNALSNQAVKPSGLTPIPLGDDIVTENMNNDSVYGVLSTNTQLKMSSSQGLSSQIVFQDPSKSNYSAIKSMLALGQIKWSVEFDDLVEKVMKPIIYNVIKAGVTAGHIQADDYFQNPRKYHKLDFMRVSEIDIEPTKTAMANKQNLLNGTHSKREIVAKRGRNIEDVYREEIEDEIARQKMRVEMFKKAGVKIPQEEQEQ